MKVIRKLITIAIVMILTAMQCHAAAQQPDDGALLEACRNNDLEVITTLLAAGADVNKPINEFDDTPLHIACTSGNTAVVEMLFKKGANKSLNKRNKCGNTPLHEACCSGHADVVMMLIRARANVNNANYYDWTPLHYACGSRNAVMVEILLEAGANESLNKRNESGDTPLNEAYGSEDADIVNLLLIAYLENGENVPDDLQARLPKEIREAQNQVKWKHICLVCQEMLK